MRSTIGKIAMAVLALFLVAYVVYQGVDYFYTPYRLETVYKYTFQDSVVGKGVFIRDEKTVVTDIDGVVDFIHNDSEMVSKGYPIAEIYPTNQDILNIERVKELQEEIDMLKASENTDDNYLSVFDTIGTQISDALGDIVVDMRSGNISNTAEEKTELLKLINRRQIIAGIEKNYDGRIAELTAEIERIQNSTAEAQGYIYADQKGYFSSSADGYECVLTPDDIEILTIENYENIIEGKGSQNVSDDVVGKLVTDHKWYCAVVVTAEEAQRFKEGDSLSIIIDEAGLEFLPVTVVKIITEETEADTDAEDAKAVVVIKCGYMSDKLASLRTAEIEITFGAVSGLRIPSSSIRMVGGVKGVYVLKKQTVRYRPIEVLREQTGFSVVKMNPDDNGALQQFDEIFVEGNDLYDGKHID